MYNCLYSQEVQGFSNDFHPAATPAVSQKKQNLSNLLGS